MTEKRHLFVVEDDQSAQDAMCRALRAAGYGVSPFRSSHAALRALESDAPAEMLISTVKMPPGQPHGFALARMARARRPGIKIVYVTAYPELAEEDTAAELGPIIEKPLAVEELVSAVRAQLPGTKARVAPAPTPRVRDTAERRRLWASAVIDTARLLQREEDSAFAPLAARSRGGTPSTLRQ